MNIFRRAIRPLEKTFPRGSSTFLSLLFLILMLLSAVSTFGQTAGVVSGHISDSTSAAVPDTKIVLRSTSTGTTRETTSTSTGDYTFSEVPVGPYTLSVSREGFKTTTSEEFQVQVQQTVRLDVMLQLGNVTETIEVQAAGTLLQAENGTVGTVIENKAINELPLNGRNYLALVALSSNVNTLSPSSGQANSRLGGDRAAQALAVGGQRIMFDYYTLDGILNTDPDFNTYIALPSIDGIQEFKTQTGVYSAEYGHQASQVNVVSKSGTNAFHGSAYEFIRNNYVDALPYYFSYNPTAPTVNPFKWNDYGFVFDGPVRIPKVFNGKDKFFFMVDDEWRRIRSNGTATATVPTAVQQNGDFSTYATRIYDPATGTSTGMNKQQFSCNGVLNVICPSRISDVSKRLLKYYAVGPTPSTGNPNYRYPTNSPQNRQSFTARGDYYMSTRSQFAFRFSQGDEDIINTGLSGAGSKTITQYYQYMGSNTFTFTPHLVNEARFGYSHFYNSLGLLSAFTTDVVTGLQIPGLSGGPSSTWGIPFISFGTIRSGTTNFWSNFGDTQDGPYVVDDPAWQIVDNVSWTKGKHSLRMGMEYSRQQFNQLGNQFSRGQFNFAPNTTAFVSTNSSGSNVYSGGDAFAEFLLGNIQQSSVAVAVANAQYRRNVWAAYIDDTFKFTPKLTLSLGLRYELTPPWVDALNDQFTVYVPNAPTFGSGTQPQAQWPFFVRQGNCSDPYQGLSIYWTDSTGKAGTRANPAARCSNGLLPDALVNTAKMNWAPRFSLSYSPVNGMVIRAGYGIFYNQDVGNAYFDMARNIAGRVTVNANTSTPAGTADLFWNNALPGGTGAVAAIPGTTGLYAYANAVSHKTSYTEQFLLNLQQQFGKDWVLEAGYLGSVSRHLYGFLNMNQPTPYGYIGNGAQTSVASRLPFLNYGVIQLVHDQGSASYHGGAAKVTRRFSNGLNIIASYTYSKSLDNGSGIRNQGNDLLFPQNSYCLRCEYGPSAFDVTHRLSGSILYDLPIGPGKLVNVKGFMDALIGGWQLGTIFTEQTGQPITPSVGADNSSIGNSNGTFDRPDPTGISPYLSSSARTFSVWANKAAFKNNAPGFFGSVARGSYRAPGLINTDASLHKNFKMPYSEKHQLSIRFEAFNVLNHMNVGAPNMNINSATFGRVGSTGNMRQLQLAAKYSF